MENRKFQIYRNSDRENTVLEFTVSAPMITGAEQNLVLLDDEGKAVAVIELQPGFDRREVKLQ